MAMPLAPNLTQCEPLLRVNELSGHLGGLSFTNIDREQRMRILVEAHGCHDDATRFSGSLKGESYRSRFPAFPFRSRFGWTRFYFLLGHLFYFLDHGL